MGNITIHRVKSHTPEWHQFRMNGIGGSEVSCILNLNKWKPALILFHEKVGIKPIFDDPNERMFHGRLMEDYIANLWRYWDGTKEGMMRNYDEGRVVRECRRVNGYAVNEDYPWLFASVDRLINQGQVTLSSGEIVEGNQILECKQLSEYASRMWLDKIPPGYVSQVQQYMMIYGCDFAELAVLKDGNDFDVYPLTASSAIQNAILTKTKEFWDKVLVGREHKALYERGDITYQEFETVMHEIEPDVDDSDAIKEYMSERFTKERNDMMADSTDIQLAKEQHILKLVIDVLSSQRDLKKNQLTKKIVDNKVERLEMDSMGYARYYLRSGGKNHQLDIRLKDTADCEKIAQGILKGLGL